MTASDLETWLREIVNGAQKLLTSASHLSIACRWRGLESRLLLHQDYGLTLVQAAGVSVSEAHTIDNGTTNYWTFSQMTNPSPSTVLWSFPFERLRSTADDGCSILWLNFGKDGEQEIDLPGGAKPVVFILLNMLSTKLLRRKACTYLNVDIPP
ncbi:unnamed protein product [Dibothriocephalus latus]|uniref:Syntrophin C-terminal PH domain-containing protein n=1 Tax=Dibothriocephalus latus TaxID=60516 RepID=A0A3P7NQQ9_DIBLA|nr:unnamed protein product [Dibothriocephalus latus]